MSLNNIQHFFSSGVYARQAFIPKNHVVTTHSHNYDHLSILASGKVIVCDDKECNGYTAPAVITIKSGIPHAIQSLTDAVWYCIHATEETDINNIDEVLIKEK